MTMRIYRVHDLLYQSRNFILITSAVDYLYTQKQIEKFIFTWSLNSIYGQMDAIHQIGEG